MTIDLFEQSASKPKIRSWLDLNWFQPGGGRGRMLDKLQVLVMGTLCPSSDKIYKALDLTPFMGVRVVILGQDPYPNPKHAMGLSFSVPPSTNPLPKSLQNIFKEMVDDIGCRPPTGDLTGWARQGVLLLNTTLTTEAWHSAAHTRLGWEYLTYEVLEALVQYRAGIVFILWGSHANKVFKYTYWKLLMPFKKNGHHIIESSHPSPFSADRGFFGSRPFSRTNELLGESIDWCLRK